MTTTVPITTTAVTVTDNGSTVALAVTSTAVDVSVGVTGPQGATGEGVPAGGADGAVLVKASAADYDDEWTTTPTGIALEQSQVTSLVTDLAAKSPLSAEAVGIGKEFASHPWQANSFTTNVAQNELRLWPSWCPQAGTYSEVRIRVGSTPAPASTVWRLGVYADSSGQPGALIADLGTIDPTTAGVKAITGLSLVLPYGRIWVGFAMQGTASTGGTYFSGYPRESVNVSAFGVAYLHVSNTGVTGALPSTFATATGQSTGLPPSILFLRSA